VAGFLGSPSMNFVEARLVASGDTLGVMLDDGTALPLPLARADKLASRRDEAVILGLRPEHMTRAHAGDDRAGIARHSATIELLQPTGSRTYATFKLGGTDVVAELQAHDVMAINQKVELAFDMNRAVLIDAGTEKVI
jgi:multiple sugar transport system ATP-binding protein